MVLSNSNYNIKFNININNLIVYETTVIVQQLICFTISKLQIKNFLSPSSLPQQNYMITGNINYFN